MGGAGLRRRDGPRFRAADKREYYAIEDLWADAPHVDWERSKRCRWFARLQSSRKSIAGERY